MSLIEIINSKLKDGCHFENELVTFINPFSYLELRKTNILNSFDRVYIDGIFLVLILRLLNIKVSRYSFDMTSLAPVVFNLAIKNNETIYFLGAKPEEIQKFIFQVNEYFPRLQIAGYRNGYFKTKEEKEREIEKIISLKPDYVIAGLGTPNQEKMLINIRNKGWNGSGFTCGGFIHQTAKGINYYPTIINKLHLRWLYRFFDEKRVLIRTLKTYPKFIIIIIYDYFKK